MSNLKYKLTSPLLMWVILFIGGVIIWLIVPRGILFHSGLLGFIVVVLGVVNWLFIAYHVDKVHKKAPLSVAGIDQVITEGAYAFVRHPVYLSYIILVWCVFVIFPEYRMLFAACWATLVFVFWSALEERMLEDKFMDDYKKYKQRVPMLIPNFKKN